MDDEDKEKNQEDEEVVDKKEEPTTEKDKEEVNEKPIPKENNEEKKDAEEGKDEVNEEPVPEENGEEETIVEKSEDTEKEENQTKKENKQLKNIFLVIGFLVIIFLGVFLFINSVRHFTYDGLDFEVIKEGELIFYKTTFPKEIIGQITGHAVRNDYNFYFRNDPRKLRDVGVEGDIYLKKNLVLNFEEEFNCDGDGIIAVANLLNMFEAIGIDYMTDETAGCDADGRYTFIRLQPGNETSIEQFGPSCYNLNVNDCEILEVTEKYIIEIISITTENLG